MYDLSKINAHPLEGGASSRELSASAPWAPLGLAPEALARLRSEARGLLLRLLLLYLYLLGLSDLRLGLWQRSTPLKPRSEDKQALRALFQSEPGLKLQFHIVFAWVKSLEASL